MILVDTNVFSELTKPTPDSKVVDWLFAHRQETLLSAIVVAELDLGVRTTPGARKRAMLEGWLERLIAVHEGRLVDFGFAAARRWALMSAPVLLAERRAGSRGFDTLLAAQALTLGVPLATRNWSHFDEVDLTVVDPWQG